MNAESLEKWFKDEGDKTLLIDYPLTGDSIVFDVGGYKGNWSDKITKRYGPTITICEPVSGFYAECVERFCDNPKISVCKYGLSDKTEDVDMALSFDSSSIYTKGDSIEHVQLFDVADIIKTPVDLISINIEGGEYRLLARMLDTDVVNLCQNIQIQFHDTYPKCERLRDEIRELLRNTHLETYNYPFVWESWRKK